jgi:RNA ligase (TIGR02306 family)
MSEEQYPADIAPLYRDLCTVEVVEEVVKHPNADKLDLVKILGYWAIVSRDAYKTGDLVAFVAPDSVLPTDKAWAATYLPHTRAGRVRAVRLRGEWSMGIVIPMDVVREEVGNPLRVFQPGDDVTSWMGLTKWEPMQPGEANARGGLPFNIPKTDETAWQKVRNLDELMGKDVDITLKIDGQSFTAYCIPPGHWPGETEPKYGITSRSLDLKVGEDFDSNWHKVERKYELLDKLIGYCLRNDVALAVRGEVYGRGIQSFPHNPHSQKDLDLAIYSVYNIDEKRYETPTSKHSYRHVAMELRVPAVPLLGFGPLNQHIIDLYDSGIEVEKDGMGIEGVVIKGDGFSFKVINKHYDAKK